jgi:hypothetical protein
VKIPILFNLPAGQPVSVRHQTLQTGPKPALPFFGGPRGEPDGDAQAVFPRGALHYGARFLDRALPSRRLAARFFLCPRKPRHVENCRGLRLVWLLVAAGSLR